MWYLNTSTESNLDSFLDELRVEGDQVALLVIQVEVEESELLYLINIQTLQTGNGNGVT